jgi:hypothetical protein
VVPTTRRRDPDPGIVATMPTAEPLRVSVEIDRDVSPISGRIAVDGASGRSFAGWTELCAAIDAALVFDRARHTTKEGSPDAQAL